MVILFAPWAGILWGGLAVVVLLYRKGQKSKLDDGAVAFLGGASAVGGVKVCVLAVMLAPQQVDPLQVDRVSLFLGGLALVWVSVQAIWQRITSP